MHGTTRPSAIRGAKAIACWTSLGIQWLWRCRGGRLTVNGGFLKMGLPPNHPETMHFGVPPCQETSIWFRWNYDEVQMWLVEPRWTVKTGADDCQSTWGCEDIMESWCPNWMVPQWGKPNAILTSPKYQPCEGLWNSSSRRSGPISCTPILGDGDYMAWFIYK